MPNDPQQEPERLFIEIAFEGYFLARLATDPDPSYEERGLSGFTYAIAGEDLLDPSIFFQREDVLEAYGPKDGTYSLLTPDDKPKGHKPFEDDRCDPADAPPKPDYGTYQERFGVKNIREASPDYAFYRERGIGVRVTEVRYKGKKNGPLTDAFLKAKARVRITNDGVPTPGQPDRLGPIFEGRNQIDSDGDPDRFSVNPFVIQVLTYSPKPPGGCGAKPDGTCFDRHVLLGRYDPLDHKSPSNPQPPLVELTDFEAYYDRLPKQRFGASAVLMEQIGVADAGQHFVNRGEWLAGRVAVAQAKDNPALVEAYKSRQYAVGFFTQATGPTVLQNRLASRIPLRQLYKHPVRGTKGMEPPPVVDKGFFSGILEENMEIDDTQPWDVLYYLGAYDGDLMAGFMDGVLSVPLRSAVPTEGEER